MKKATKNERKVYGWHFLTADRRLGYGDGRYVEPGHVYSVACAPVMCSRGLHASKNPLDAFRYKLRLDAIVCRVRLWGELGEGSDKIVAKNREVLWMAQLNKQVIRRFACLCALDVAHLWTPPKIVLRYLKTQDESIRSVAYVAAKAYAEAYAEAYAATTAAADDAEAYAAATAATAAAEAYAAATAARTQIIKKQNRRFARMLSALPRLEK